jgi:hypothetical protein
LTNGKITVKLIGSASLTRPSIDNCWRGNGVTVLTVVSSLDVRCDSGDIDRPLVASGRSGSLSSATMPGVAIIVNVCEVYRHQSVKPGFISLALGKKQQ